VFLAKNPSDPGVSGSGYPKSRDYCSAFDSVESDKVVP
jgi:hypothetical protein